MAPLFRSLFKDLAKAELAMVAQAVPEKSLIKFLLVAGKHFVYQQLKVTANSILGHLDVLCSKECMVASYVLSYLNRMGIGLLSFCWFPLIKAP